MGADEASRILEHRGPRPDLAADPALPDDTRIWAALQDVSGGAWGGAVYDADATDGGSLTNSLGGADGGLFSIDSGTGVVTLTANPNRREYAAL